MFHIRKRCLWLIVFVLLCGCAGARPTPQLCQDEDVKRRAGMTVGRIAQYADPGTKYYFVVVESNEINAFMDSRKNLVGLTTGLMNAMDDQELAFVVAHEVSHNTLGHYGKKVIASEATTTAFRVANVFLPGIGLLNLLVNPAVTNAFSREFELDADRKAAEIVANAMNVPVEDSMAALLRLKAQHGESSTFILFASHPPIDDRVQNLATSFSVNTDPNEILEKKTLAKASANSDQAIKLNTRSVEPGNMGLHQPDEVAMKSGELPPITQKAPVHSGPFYYQILEQEFEKEVNLARTSPGAYVSWLQGQRQYYQGTQFRRPGEVPVRTKEGLAAVNEAIRFLDQQRRPVGPLTISGGLSAATRYFVRAQGTTGGSGNKGPDGSLPSDRIERYGTWETVIGESVAYGQKTARDAVTALIVSDGDPSRTSRKNVFNTNYRVAGVACGLHIKYGHMCAITFAGGFRANAAYLEGEGYTVKK